MTPTTKRSPAARHRKRNTPVPAANVDPSLARLDDPSLDRFRPRNLDLERRYVSRKLANGLSDIDVLSAYWERRTDGHPQNVGLMGETQCGKTMLVEVMAFVLARRLGLSKPLPVFTLSGSSAITDHDIFGQYRPVEVAGVEQLVWMEGIVAMACRVGGILYLDEVNAMQGNVTAALHPVLDHRRQFVNLRKPVTDGFGGHAPEVVSVSPHLWCVSTCNPGYAGMAKMNAAFANRFQWLLWGYDRKVESRLVPSTSVRLVGDALRMAKDQRVLSTPVGTSALMRLADDIRDFGVDFAIQAFLGQFAAINEQSKVEAILNDRSLIPMLKAEWEQNEQNNETTTAGES